MEFNLPLESWLKRAARRGDKFPVPGENYFTRYCTLKEKLNTHVYAHVGAALLQKHDPDDANAPGIEIYTDHGLGHVNAVIKMAGKMLGCEKTSSKIGLEPYEVYLLLCCILCHDAGNIYGRVDHELNVRRVLREKNIGVLSEEDINAVHKIAKTHTGKRLVGEIYTNDTIQSLETDAQLLFQANYRPRIIAAVLRLADEMSEDRLRVPKVLLDEPGVKDGGSGIFLLYANSILNSSADRQSRTLRIDYELQDEQILKRYKKFKAKKEDGKIVGFSEQEIYLLDEIIDRLKKANRERVYCNRHADGVFVFSRLVASLTVLIPQSNHDLREERLAEIEMYDVGYPGEEASHANSLSAWEAEKVYQEVQSRRGSS